VSRRRRSLGAGEGVSIVRRRRSGSAADLDITPMIDVTFLLLIFFMVTSTMNPASDVHVPVAEYGVGVAAANAAIITVKLSDNGPPTIELGEDTGQIGALQDVSAFVEREALEGRFDVIIRADRDVPHGFVQKVGQQVANVEGALFSYEVEDKPSY